MTFTNNVSHESGNKTTASIHFVNLFPFYTKIQTNILLRVGIEKPAQKNHPIKPNKTWPQVFFFNFFFVRYLNKHFISIILIVIVLQNILPCNSRETYVYT